MKARRKKAGGKSITIPQGYSWVVRVLSKAYGLQRTLAVLGDISRIIRKRNQEGRNGSLTTCVACGGWIPIERERRHLSTCSEECYGWIRRLWRAQAAQRQCRYCGHGMPQELRRAIRMRRPRRTIEKLFEKHSKALAQGAKGYQKAPAEPKIGLLVPDQPEGVEVG